MVKYLLSLLLLVSPVFGQGSLTIGSMSIGVINTTNAGGGYTILNLVSNSFTASSQLDNNYTIGENFYCPSVPITITALGRYCYSGNTGNHQLGLWTAGGTLLASVTLQTSGLSAGINYTNLATPITLSANGNYVVGCLEATASGDTYTHVVSGYISSSITNSTVIATYGAGSTLTMPTTSALIGGTYGVSFQFHF